jgi:hypothetical protein
MLNSFQGLNDLWHTLVGPVSDDLRHNQRSCCIFFEGRLLRLVEREEGGKPLTLFYTYFT